MKEEKRKAYKRDAGAERVLVVIGKSKVVLECSTISSFVLLDSLVRFADYKGKSYVWQR